MINVGYNKTVQINYQEKKPLCVIVLMYSLSLSQKWSFIHGH